MNSRLILVTGANGGLGQAITRAFLQESPDNFVCMGVRERRDKGELSVNEFLGRCECVNLDVTSRPSWKEVVTQILARHKRIDVLVNNAGKHADSLLGTMPVEAWDEVLSTNLDSAFHGCQPVLPTMIGQRGGRIINVASLSALLAPPGQTNYPAAKAGLVAITQPLPKQMALLTLH